MNDNNVNANNAAPPGQQQQQQQQQPRLINNPQIAQLSQQQLQQLMMRFKSESELATRLGANSEEGRRHYATASTIKTILINYKNQQKLKQQQQQAQQQEQQQKQQQKPQLQQSTPAQNATGGSQNVNISPAIGNTPAQSNSTGNVNINMANRGSVDSNIANTGNSSAGNLAGAAALGNMNMANMGQSRPASLMEANNNQQAPNANNFAAARSLSNVGFNNVSMNNINNNVNNNNSNNNNQNVNAANKINNNFNNAQNFNNGAISNTNSPALSGISASSIPGSMAGVNTNMMNGVNNATVNANNPNVNNAANAANAGQQAGTSINNTPLMIQVQNLKKLNYIYQEYSKKLANYKAFLQKPNLAPETIQKLKLEGAAVQTKLEQIKVLTFKLSQSLRQNRGNISNLAQQQALKQKTQQQQQQPHTGRQPQAPGQPQQAQTQLQQQQQPGVPQQAQSPAFNMLQNNAMLNNQKSSIQGTPSPFLGQAFLNNNNNSNNNSNFANIQGAALPNNNNASINANDGKQGLPVIANGMIGGIPINQSMLNKLTPQQRNQLIQQYQKNRAMQMAALSRANNGKIPANLGMLAANQGHPQMPKPSNIQNPMSPLSGSPSIGPVASPMSVNMPINNQQIPLNAMGRSPVAGPQTPVTQTAIPQLLEQQQQQQQIPQQIPQPQPLQMHQPSPQLQHQQRKPSLQLLSQTLPQPHAQALQQPQAQQQQQQRQGQHQAVQQQQPQQAQQQLQPQLNQAQQLTQPLNQNQKAVQKSPAAQQEPASAGQQKSQTPQGQQSQPPPEEKSGSAAQNEQRKDVMDLTKTLIQDNILKEPISSIPISKELKLTSFEPVLLKDFKPSINGGFASAPILSTPAMIKIPDLQIESGDGKNRVVTKRKLNELVKTVGLDEGDGETTIGGDVEEILLDLADEFVNSVTNFACQLAKRRKVDAIDSKDIQLHLEKGWNIKIPGYANDDIRNIRKWLPTPSYVQKINGVDVSRSVDRQTKNQP